MNKKIKAKWVAALRSGQYKQTQNQLRDGNKFCCLGVLCNIHAQEHPRIAKMQKNPKVYMGETTVLPEAVIKWSGLKDDCGGQVIYRGLGEALTELNDNEELSFKKIAKLIEAQL